ncbi:MAG: hypothetical protein R2688_06665 [Fimbriimonadaceae bacterium]
MNDSLLSWEKARKIVSSFPALIKTNSINIEDACGLVCTEDVCAKYASPPFDNSAVDGFAVFPGFEQFKHVSLVESVYAGSTPAFSEFNQDQAVRIMTGAPVPAGAERVVMQEDCTCEGNQLVIHQLGKAGQHMRRLGEDFISGEKICRAGTMITPGHIGLLASAESLKSMFMLVRPLECYLLVTKQLIQKNSSAMVRYSIRICQQSSQP